VDEAKKALLPATAKQKAAKSVDAVASLKSFDFVVYAPHGNLLVDVKGRMFGSAKSNNLNSNRRFESWVTQDDVDSLTRWQDLFGRDFTATFVFAYCLRQQPPDALFDELFAFNDHWYALREATLSDYVREMKPRSASWKTLHVPGQVFSRISQPFLARAAACRTDADPVLFG
jgi:hypothetical protein